MSSITTTPTTSNQTSIPYGRRSRRSQDSQIPNVLPHCSLYDTRISAHSLSGTSYLIHSNTLAPPLSAADTKLLRHMLNAAEVFGDTLGRYSCEEDRDDNISEEKIAKANITAALSMACDTVLGKGVVPLSRIEQLNIITDSRSWGWKWGRPKGIIADLSASIFSNENETRTALSIRKTCEKYRIEYEVDDANRFERDGIYVSDPSVITELIERKRWLFAEEREEGSDTSISGGYSVVDEGR